MTMTATYSPDDNKLRLYPVARLDSETYDRVKAAGLRWAPMQKLFFAPTWSPRAEDLMIELCGEIGDEDTTLTDRAEERADRFEGYSENRMADAERARKAVDAIAEHIPFGQPVLLGHHSEKHARRDKEKIDAGMRKAVKMWETSTYWTERAAGAIRHAKYKELPAVRHRRIKTIESDKRKVEKEFAKAERELKAWQIVAGITDPDKQRAAGLAVANGGGYWSMSFPLADYPRDPPASQYEGPMGVWSAIDGNVITAAQAAAIAIPGLERSLPRKARWIAHYENRLAYERAMLAEQIGSEVSANPLADRFAFAVGGQVVAGRSAEWVTVLKVNKGVNGSVSSLATTTPEGSRSKRAHWRVESVHDYRAPSAENVAAAKAATKLPPLCNYPGEGFAHLTQADYDKVPKDYRGYRPRAATDAAGAHRTRVAIGIYAFRGTKCDDNKRHSMAPVFITDAKRVDPPKVIPPSEPANAAEFVAEFVTAPEFAAQLETVAEIMAEPARALGTAEEEAKRAGGEIITGLGQYRAGHGQHVTDWCNDEATAWREFCGLAGVPFVEPTATIAAARAGIAAAVPDAPALAPLPVAADFPAPSPTSDFEAMRATLKGGGVQVVVAPQLFPTPAGLAAEMVEVAGIRPGDDILEPSAGTGAILAALPNVRPHGTVTAVEINQRLADGLREIADETICADFLECNGSLGKFDKILMNSPFAPNAADIRHIEHARRFLKPGGRLVAICADGPRQRERLQPIASEYRPLPAGTFKNAGTMVNTALVVIDAPPA